MRRLALVVAIIGACLSSLAAAPVAAQDPANTVTTGCAVCHPGAVKGLRQSVHAGLVGPGSGDDRCASCHGDLAGHIASARRPESTLVHAALVSAASCKACHAGSDWPTDLGSHAWHAEIVGPTDAAPPASPVNDLVIPPATGLQSFDWSGLLIAGNRFVSRSGSIDRYDTDVNLDSGARLVEARVTGEGRSELLDRIDLSARDIGDPWSRLSAELEKTDSYRAHAAREDRVFHYRARGDYSRVSHDEESDSLGIEVGLGDDWWVFADFDHFEDDGHWLTQRLAGRGTTPLVPVGGVDSPRSLDSDTWSVGTRGGFEQTRFLIAFDYLDETSLDRWSFARPAPGNPLVTESEDFTSRGHTHGPGFHGTLEHDFGPVHAKLDFRHRELERDTDASGTATGADPIEFVTTTSATTRGDADTTWLGTELTADLDDALSLSFELRWRDHDEHQFLDSIEVTDFPVAGGSSSVIDRRDQRTHQERWTGSLALDAEIVDHVVLTLGAGFSREKLELPQLPSGGLDPTGGTIRDAGGIAGVRWTPDREWTFESRFQGFGQSGLALSEQQEHDSREWEARLRRRGGALAWELSARSTRVRNDASDYRFDRDSIGLSGTWTASDSLSVFASYVFTDTDSSTLTNFYFDPDPDPVATVVGFRGRTQTVAAGVQVGKEEGCSWRTDVAWTGTGGSADLQTLDLRTDLSIEVTEGGAAGARYQHIDYVEQGGVDDYHADLLLLYWRQQIGPRRH